MTTTSSPINSAKLNKLPHQTAWEINLPRIFVKCVAAESEGIEHGAWIDAISAKEMQANITYILRNSPVPNSHQYRFTATQHFQGLAIKGKKSLPHIAEVGLGVMNIGKPFILYYELYDHREIPNLIKAFTDDYVGVFNATEDFVKEKLQELIDVSISELLQIKHINLQLLIQDWFNSTKSPYRRILDDKQVYIFENRFRS